MMKSKPPLSSDQKRYAQEATITKKVKDWLDVQPDITYYKASDRYHKGISDFILCVNGIFVAIELKADDGKPSPHQNLFIAQVQRSHGVAGVAYTMAEVKALVEEARRRTV